MASDLALTNGAESVQGTAAVHDAGWAHMDLKPDNLCMEIQDGLPHPYLVDFGSSLMQDTSRFTISARQYMPTNYSLKCICELYPCQCT